MLESRLRFLVAAGEEDVGVWALSGLARAAWAVAGLETVVDEETGVSGREDLFGVERVLDRRDRVVTGEAISAYWNRWSEFLNVFVAGVVDGEAPSPSES